MAHLEGIERWKLSHTPNFGQLSTYGTVPSTMPAFDVNRGIAGSIPSVGMQYHFLKGTRPRGQDISSPANRPIAYALDRDMKERMNRSVNEIGLTQQQIRVNQFTNSGTSIPKTTQFDPTSDYHRLRKPITSYADYLFAAENLPYIVAGVVLIYVFFGMNTSR